MTSSSSLLVLPVGSVYSLLTLQANGETFTSYYSPLTDKDLCWNEDRSDWTAL